MFLYLKAPFNHNLVSIYLFKIGLWQSVLTSMSYQPYRGHHSHSQRRRSSSIAEMATVGSVSGYFDSIRQVLTIDWKIPHYRRYSSVFLSPTFGSTTCSNYDHDWHLAIHPNGSKRAHRDHVSLYLYSDERNKTTRVKLTMSITRMYDNMASNFMQCHNSKVFQAETGGFGFHHFIDKQYLLDPDSCFISSDDTLTVRVVIEHQSLDDPTSVIDVPALIIMSQDILKMYQLDDHLADVTFEVDGKFIQAHKSLLSARSPVFRAMFQTKMEETFTDKVHVEDIEYDVMQALLKYIYSANIDENIEGTHQPLFVVKLFAAADKYQIEYLRNLCELHICNSLNSDVVVSALITGHLHESVMIKRACFDLLSTLNVRNLEDFSEVKRLPGLMEEMICYWQETDMLKPYSIAE